MAVRSVEFLPEIFQTPVNRQFLAGTLDQLIQEPNFSSTQGFIGRRIGPGVNANDYYVIEPSVERSNYQLEPGVVITNRDREDTVDAITYPGILDALALQGADTTRADRLFVSDYYAWDPFIDYDKMVNFAEYYWLPAGPFAVSVAGEQIPYKADINVTRNNGYYSFDFSNTAQNPTLTLVRGGSYNFKVTQNLVTTFTFRVSNRGSSAYLIDFEPNPVLTLIRGNTYQFTLTLGGDFPFYIKTIATTGKTNLYNNGVVNNGASQGQVTFTVPYDAPDTLFYAAETSETMRGTFNIVDPVPGDGPKFYLQAAPGVDGKMPGNPNISSRDVLGVVNNGEDLGTVTFNVPLKTAQNFYYSLTEIPNVDLVSELTFAQINNQYLDDFIAANPNGIDGITNLQDNTVVFVDQFPITDAEDATAYGWVRTQFYSPNPPTTGVSEPGTYDIDGFSTNTPILTKTDRYQVYIVKYETALDGRIYLSLQPTLAVSNFEQFNIVSGEVYSNTKWFKNSDGYFEQIPLLTAALDTIYYQDGTNPSMFGAIRLIDQTQDTTIFIADIVGKKNYTSPNGVEFTNGLKVTFFDNVVPTSYIGNSYYVEGVGSAIKLLLVTEFITPETYTQNSVLPFDSLPYDIGNYDINQNQPAIQDYLTSNRASEDFSAWSRSNRWFHREVIEATAVYTNTTALFDQTSRAKRPILEFKAGMRLYNFGTKSKQPINIIDLTTVDAFSQVAGQTQYNIDGYALTDGSRVIFAADTSADVRNRVYEVVFITPDTEPPLIAQPIINLVATTDSLPLINDTVVCMNGISNQGISFWYDGVSWNRAQQKTKTNQAPLFDLFDQDGVSLTDQIKYPGSSFTGTKLFSYAQGTGANDVVLNFPLRYLTISNVGDIVFDNNLYTDTFLYVINRSSIESDISIGFARQYSSREVYQSLLGWQPAVTQSRSLQQFRFSYNGDPLLLDIKISDVPVAVDAPEPVPNLKVYAGSTFVPPSKYLVTTTPNTTTIRLYETYLDTDVIEVLAYSDQVSQVGFYQVPINLQNNPFNANSASFTLGTVRTHYNSIGENLTELRGAINGTNNSRDLGNIVPYGETIVQQSSPLTLSGLFLRLPDYNVFSSIDFNSREYVKYKTLLLDTLAKNDYTNLTTAQILTSVISDITLGRTESNAFYWSDMLPAGAVFTQNSYTYTAISTPVFETVQVYNFTSSNYLGLNVFVNNRLLTREFEFNTIVDSASLEITTLLAVGDVILIQEFSSTVGSFCPNTPTKMGLYPSWRPQIYVDTSYVEPTTIILGHDGSKTVAFGDFRDDVLLEFENRIFNNIKIVSPIPILPEDIIPGAFRTTDYSAQEVQEVFAGEFLSWIGWNKLDYNRQDYSAQNSFTWNYDQAGNKLNGQVLPGAWRGIYLDFYDTVTPHTTPWEMLGLTQKPTWWNDRYGPAPYTSGNLVLWDDLEAGLVTDPAGFYMKPAFARPGLTKIIPVGPTGELLSPFESIVGAYDPSGFRHSWQTGDYGPVEYSWRASSSYPFAVMRLFALTRPAEFFSLLADRDLYKYNTTLNQFLYNDRYRLDANGIEIYGLGTSKASFINWIVDYNAYLGNLQAPQTLGTALKRLDVRLCYRMASFSNKQYLKLFLEKPSPASLNTTLLIPDNGFDLLLYKNQPFDAVSYSSVIVQQVDNGYQVFGYSTVEPYFQVLVSRPSGQLQEISGGGSTVKVPAQYTTDIVRIPYGYTFVNDTVMVDFLLSYGKFLESRGFSFGTIENGYTINWQQMAVEFLYWSNQGWGPGSLINLNPSAKELFVQRDNAVVDSIVTLSPDNQIQDQNKQLLGVQNLIIERFNNEFRASTQDNQVISFVNLKFTAYEHLIVFRNVTVFGDLIYDPTTGARQNRLRLFGNLTNDWNGQLNAPGFILNQDNIEEWAPNVKYTKGEIVLFKNNYWSALTIVQPKEKFDFNDWAASDREKIQTGLLPNIPNKADQLANSYNVNVANLESDNDLLAYGLIGFRPRQYMAALDLDDVSQVNVYKQFLGSKGTIESVRLLTNANFDKEGADYTVYENWAIQAGVYGAQANRSYVDLRLNQALLTANPSVVQIITTGQSSIADQAIELANVWSTSTVLMSTDIFPTITLGFTDDTYPSAGYVNLEDADITVFSLDDSTVLNQYLSVIGVGTSIWVAKVNDYDWNIYRAEDVPGQLSTVTDNLDGTSILTFTAQHRLSVGDTIIVKFFDDTVNGVYKVIRIPSLTTVSIVFAFTNPSQIVATGVGLVLRLQTMRVAQASDAIDLPYVNNIQPGSLIWVDNNGFGKWQVLQKNSPVESLTSIAPGDTEPAFTRFGYALAQRQDNSIVLVGQPDQANDRGGVVNFGSIDVGSYTQGSTLSLRSAVDVVNYGSSLSVGNNTYGSAGAPNSAALKGYASVLVFDELSSGFFESQILLALDSPGAAEFGYSVAISKDERWLYIGAPGVDDVYAYGKVDVESQINTFVTTSTQQVFPLTGIQFNVGSQLTVVYNGQTLTYIRDYAVTSNTVNLTFFPILGSTLVISRSKLTQLDRQEFFGLTANVTTGVGSGAIFNVDVVRGKYTAFVSTKGTLYSLGDTLTIYGTQFGGTAPLNNCVITVTDVGILGTIEAYTTSGFFVPLSGLVKTFNLANYLYSASGYDSITIAVDGTLYRPVLDYTMAGTTVTFLRNPDVGSTIIVTASTYFKYVTSFTAASGGERFGTALSSGTDGRQIVVGTPNATVSGTATAGKVFVFDRSAQRFQVTDARVLTYTPAQPLVNPTTVLLNGVLQYSNQYYYNGTYSSNGTAITFLIDLAIGDIIEIETNQFTQIQTLTSSDVEEGAKYGFALDFCPNNCSIYISAPFYSGVLPQAGSVERTVNQSRVFGIITNINQNPALTAGNTLRINDYEVAVPAGSTAAVRLAAFAAAIASSVPNVTASVTNGYLTIQVQNLAASTPLNRLTVLPGAVGSAFTTLGYTTFAYAQTISSPYPQDYAQFGYAVNIDSSAEILTVGTPNGTLIIPTTFDDDTTIFDSLSTTFSDYTPQSGVVYTFNFLPAASSSIANFGNFIFGQEIYDDSVTQYDEFGISISYVNNILLVGSPGKEKQDSTIDALGRVALFINPTYLPAWQVISQQQPIVNIRLLNSVSMYDRLISTTNQFFDFFNPLQGKILGPAQRNIDYVGAVNPAVYNVGQSTPGNTWFETHLGEIWWDTARVRFVDPNTGNIDYAAKRWGQVFPGSQVDVYQWIQSSQLPANYTGPGEVYSILEYTVTTVLNTQGIVENIYYYWVKNVPTVATAAEKTLSTEVIARYIEDPRSSGISYIAPVSANAIAIYNGADYIKASDTILHIEYDQTPNDANVHVVYDLVPENRIDGVLNPQLYLKFIDSLSGINVSGLPVPDPNLPYAMRYGVDFRPRQSMFIDRLLAGQNFVRFTNNVLAQFPMSELNISFALLNSAEPAPSTLSGEWDMQVANLEQLSWQNIQIQPVGYRYLVDSDSTNFGFWTIYTVTQVSSVAVKTLLLTKVQGYDTRQYWSYIDWYASTYNPSLLAIAEISNYANLATLTVPLGSFVRVTANSQSKWEIYQKTAIGWDRVGLQDGTIAISIGLFDYAEGRIGYDAEVFDTQYFDYSPEVETRKIVEAVNQQLFVDDLAIYRNELLILMFDYILSEQEAPSWLGKTSLIDVTHKIRQLLPFQNYRRDNQNFVLDYINEVKPYHVQIRQFNLQYDGADEFQGDLSDFDLPSYYDTSLVPAQYVSPILDYDGSFSNDVSAFPPNAAVWQAWPYSQWLNNYLLYLSTIRIDNAGSGYIFAPTITITGTATRLGTAEAFINSAGEISSITITDPGEGYLTTPIITITGGSGTGARLVPIMTHQAVRTFKVSLKYDRYQYRQTFVPWVPSDTFDNGTLVSYDNRIWEANSPDSSGVNTATFDPTDWILMPPGELSGVDRTMGYYVPNPTIPGRVLPLLIDGVEYPGTILEPVPFDAATGFDSDPYDLYPFDNIQNSPEGGFTYSDTILDTIFTSRFLDSYIGTRPYDLVTDGGAFVDTYSSFAPEELVPGAEFDTLDLRVYTRPGADWDFDGHGFAIANFRYEWTSDNPSFSFAGLLPYPATAQLTNITQRIDYDTYQYSVDWTTQTVTVDSADVSINPNDVLMIRAFEVGGGNQLLRLSYIGNGASRSIILDVTISEIQEIVVWVNGSLYTSSYSWNAVVGAPNKTELVFSEIFTNLDYINVTVLGVSPGTTVRSWSDPVTQYITVEDSNIIIYDLDNSLQGSNQDELIVERNGVRVRPGSDIEYYEDGSTDYFLPTRNVDSQEYIANNDVHVYVNDVYQSYGSDFVLSAWTGTQDRYISFTATPATGARILICVTTYAQYFIDAGQIIFRLSSIFTIANGDVISITTWNDTSQQDIITKLWKGSVQIGVGVSEPFDSTNYSPDTLLFDPGSFDYSASTITFVNDFDLGRANVDPTRIWVYYNGYRLVNGIGYTVQPQDGTSYLILPFVISNNDVVAVTMATNSIVPEAMAFRIFQDMRGLQLTYRMTPATTTELTQILYADDDVVHVSSASALGQPNVSINIWGVITVNAERIMYRYRNTVNNTVSGLLRGTAGTAATTHLSGSTVYDMSRGNLLPSQYQNYLVSENFSSNGTQTTFVITAFTLLNIDSTTLAEETLRVIVGGRTLLISEYTVLNEEPLTVQLANQVPSGVEITFAVYRGDGWYQPGIAEPSDGRPLQLTETTAARFLRGL